MKLALAPALRFVCLALVLGGARSGAVSENTFTAGEAEAVNGFLHAAFDGKKDCMVVGLVDEQASKVFGAGQLDNGTTNAVGANSVFFIGSVSKTFTALLLQDMAERGEVHLDDPVANYLPKSVTVPTYHGKEITLLNLATHTAGFPHDPNNMSGADTKQQFETYTIEKMYAYLSQFTLRREPGTEFEYSNLGMSLLGHALARRAGTNFEALLLNRICGPLHMEETRIVPTPEMRLRLAMGHEASGGLSPPWQLDAYAPAGAVHSTANDLLKYVSAQAGLTQSSLTPAINKTHVFRYKDTNGNPGGTDKTFFGNIAMPWMDRGLPPRPGMELLGHAGGAGSYHAWVGFDTKQRRGVVVLSTSARYQCEQVGEAALMRLPFRENILEITTEPVGIGAELAVDEETHMLLLKRVIPNSPAERAGLTDGLIIQRIGDLPTANKPVTECANLIRGKAGTAVQLEVIDAQRHTTNTIELRRQKIVLTKK
jgi:D-alanyl-D-alanine-carboxypeptidase/D-alanyl-D-alanine-endopeptidase